MGNGSVDLPGAAHVVLAAGVVHLDPEAAAFAAMLDGWRIQQRARFLNDEGTINPRIRLVRRLAEFSNQYPWQWTPAEGEAFVDQLRSSASGVMPSTVRGYQIALRMFCEYVTDGRYGWPQRCLDLFGEIPVQIWHEGNLMVHVADYEGDPRRRPLTYDEVQALFDAADGKVEEIRARRRKGSLAALRDSAMLKTVYAYGLRRRETCFLDLADLRRSPPAPDYRRFGAVFVRYGKAARGSPPKRRTVLTVPEFDWSVGVLEQYLAEVRPGFQPQRHPALWLTERCGRVSLDRLDDAFVAARNLAGLPEELDLHCLRHSYITHLVEFGYPELFVQHQVGHEYASTTALYTGVSDEYRNRLVRQALQARHGDLWKDRS